MKAAGFSFIKNAITYDYPIIEAVKSVLPLVDKFFLAVGNSEDETFDYLQSHLPAEKMVYLHTIWDESLREGGKVLAEETNKIFDHIPKNEYDWCIYIQGDEVLHESGRNDLILAMEQFKDNPIVDGLLLNYLHFYGSYEYVGASRRWYRREIRIIKNDKSIRSYKDAQGFRKNGEKLNVIHLKNVFMHHYGWVKNPLQQMKKAKSFNKLWHDDEWMEKTIPKVELFDYSEIDSLDLYLGNFPEVMKERIKNQDWEFKYDISKKKYNLKTSILMKIESLTGIRLGEYKNYKIIKG